MAVSKAVHPGALHKVVVEEEAISLVAATVVGARATVGRRVVKVVANSGNCSRRALLFDSRPFAHGETERTNLLAETGKSSPMKFLST